MTVGYNQLPSGTVFTPLLKGLPNEGCHCPHWGYIFKGAICLIYNDGSEDLTKEGDIFYWEPGHTAIVEEDVVLVDFSPEKVMNSWSTSLKKWRRWLKQ